MNKIKKEIIEKVLEKYKGLDYELIEFYLEKALTLYDKEFIKNIRFKEVN